MNNNQMLNTLIAMAQRNPNLRNNPQAQQLLNVIQSGNAKQGEQIAQNFCNTYGVSKEDAIQQALQYFHIR